MNSPAANVAPVILPGSVVHGQPATLGVMGGGQLGRMFVQAAQRMGYFTAVLDPDMASPAGLLSHHHIQTTYLDELGLGQLQQRCAAITTEFENIPAAALRKLGELRPVAPAAEAVAIAQDRVLEKAHFARCGVACAPYAVIETAEQLAAVLSGEPRAAPGRPKQASAPSGGSEDTPVPSVGVNLLPGILKTRRLGYDGKGQIRVKTLGELEQAWDEVKNVPCVLEKLLPLAAEVSVIVARGWDGTMVNFPPQRNLHRDGILAVTEVFEGNLPQEQASQAIAATRSIAQGLNYVGVLCVEFFVLQDGTLVVNEIAPRPHNSGHYTLDGCDQSQFDLQVRTLTGLPLVQPRLYCPTTMLNLLGEVWLRQAPPPWDQVLALPGVHLHLYGKQTPSKGRKMGHLNITGNSVAEVRATALAAAQLLGIAPF